MLGDIEADDFEPALKVLKAGFGSDDRPDSLPQEVYNAPIPVVMPDGATGAAETAEAKFLNNNRGTAMLGSSDFWRT
eukprot:2358273-Pyramimonas_sp.AAC.1